MEENMVKVLATVKKEMYRKDDFAIMSFEIQDVFEGEPYIDTYWNTWTAKGNIPSWEYNVPYTIIAKEVEPNKYGRQYEIISMIHEMDFSNKQNQKIFLSKILTEIQLNNLYKTIDSPFEAIEEHDIETLCKVKGIGEIVAKRIIDKYEENKDYSTAYVELDKLGLTTNMVKKLCESYGNPNIVLDRIKNNPYLIADEVNGIGWKKADEIALSSGYNRTSSKRIMAFINYYLQNEALNGNTYCYKEDLFYEIEDNLGEDITEEMVDKVVETMKSLNIIWQDEEGVALALTYYKNLEDNTAKEIIRLIKTKDEFFNYEDWEEKIKQQEQMQGWNYTDQQKQGIKTILDNNVVLIQGYAGCVDCDTEYFNGSEWVKISDYKEGDKVLQYNKDGTANLVMPKAYIKKPCDSMWHFETKYGLNQCLTDEHRVVYETSKGNLKIKSFEEVRNMHLNCNSGFTGKFYTTFNYCGKGIELSEYEIRLMCAVICDGSFNSKTNYCRINLKKQRKKDRIENILNKLNKNYKKTNKENGFTVYCFYSPRREKEFTSYWYNCNNEQFKIICDEILYWDGCLIDDRTEFSTTKKNTCDFIQFAFATQNKRVTIRVDERKGEEYITNNKIYTRKSNCYNLYISDKNKIGMGGFHDKSKKTKIIPYKTKDGYKYCFTVPSTMLVLRREGRIFVTGNTGKSSIVSGILNVLSSYSSKQCALSGKASVNLTQNTGKEGFTIHRLLEYTPKEGFLRNENNPLDTHIVILDEISMVDVKLFNSLVKAIPNGAKLILLGDSGQLESMGVGNLMKDLINSGVVPIVNLDKIHRQAEKSAIITNSIDIWNGKQIIDKDFIGIETRGELQDLTLDITKDKQDTSKNIMKYFKELYPTVNDIMDLQVIVPVKERGECCVVKLNNLIQEYIRDYNNCSKDEECISVGNYELYKGDKVINVRNNYDTKTPFGEDIPIMNGNFGIITSIESSSIVVEFEKIGKVVIPSEHLKYIELGYVATTHKLQGSGIKKVICGLDSSHYTMLSKEMLYTMLTRAKEYCVLCGDNKAIRKAVTINKTRYKQTFLEGFLQKYTKSLNKNYFKNRFRILPQGTISRD